MADPRDMQQNRGAAQRPAQKQVPAGRFAQGLTRRRGQGLGQQAADAARGFWSDPGGSGRVTTAGTPAARQTPDYYQQISSEPPATPGVTSAGTPAPPPSSPAPAPAPPPPPAPPVAPVTPPSPADSGIPGPGAAGRAFAPPPIAPAPDPGKTGDSFFTNPPPVEANDVPPGAPGLIPAQVGRSVASASLAAPDVGGFLEAQRKRGGF
jgi:hypothetical protein